MINMDIQYLSFLKDYTDLLGHTKGIDIMSIEKIEMNFRVKLPKAYKEFLFLFGEDSGNILGSYYMMFPALLENRNDALYALGFDDRKSVEDKPEIKDSFFFFGQWQGYIFYFFDCEEESDDPIVYILMDSLKIEKYKGSVTSFIKDEGLQALLDLKKQ